jgi:DNA modification methylase
MKSLITVEYWPVSKFVPYARNPRKNDHAVGRMVASMEEFGLKIPLLVRSNGEVVDGHLRLKAAHQLGLQEIPVILCDEWSQAQVKAFRLLVNRSATWAEFDLEVVAVEMKELTELGFDLQLTGFDAPEIDGFLFGEEQTNREEVIAEPPGEAITRPGEMWLCGSHRVMCGDATDRDAVALLLGGAKPTLLVTDPPYGVDYDPSWRERAGLGQPRQTGRIRNDHQADWSAAYRLFEGDVAYVWHAGVHAAEVAAGLEAAGLRIRAQIIWAKQHFALGRGDYHWQHEPAWYAVREGRESHWCGDRTQSTLWQVANLNPFGGSGEEATGHATQKPLELMRRPILNHTMIGGLAYDPFLGSGTTLIAAEATGRICYGLDIDPRYVDLAITRWQTRTGQSAVRDGDGRIFQQLAEQRTAAPAEV